MVATSYFILKISTLLYLFVAYFPKEAQNKEPVTLGEPQIKG